jgi:chemotaxis protein MotA
MKTGIGLIVGAIIVVVVHIWNGGATGDLVQPASLVFVLLGTFLSTFLSAPKGEFARAFAPAPEDSATSMAALKKELGDLASVARKEGFLALDSFRATASRNSLKDGIQYLISGFDQGSIRGLFDSSIERRVIEGESSVKIWDIAAAASPSIGALGATLGLLTALAKLDDPAQLGRGISAAMSAVLYGFFFANFVFSPLAARRRKLLQDSVVPDEMVKSAILGIQEGLNPHLIEERLKQVAAG